MARVGNYSILVWSMFILLSCVYSALNNLSFINFKTFFFIFTVNILLFVGEIFGEISVNKKRNRVYAPVSILRNNYQFLNSYIWLSSALGLLYLIIFVRINSDISELQSIPAQIASARYSFQIKSPWYLKILKIILYSGAVVAGLSSSFLTKKRYQLYIPLIIILFEGIASAGKSGFLFGLLLFLSFKITTSEIVIKNSKNKSNAKIFRYILLGICLIIFVFLAQILRLQRELDQDVFNQVFNRIIGYGITPILAFDQWFVQSNIIFPSLGKFTFAGVFDLFFNVPRTDGIYQDRAYFANGEETNVFTFYRSLISDYGIIGSILFYTIIGYLYGVLKEIKSQTINISSKIVVIHFQAVILSTMMWSVFGSFLAYNTFIFSVILSLIICHLARIR